MSILFYVNASDSNFLLSLPCHLFVLEYIPTQAASVASLPSQLLSLHNFVMETREEKLATWTDPAIARFQSFRFLEGSIFLNANELDKRTHISDCKVQFDQFESWNNIRDRTSTANLWHFKATSFPRLRPGKLALSFSKDCFRQIQDSWNLHPRTIEVFLSNNGVLVTFHSSGGWYFILLKVAASRNSGFDCASIACNTSRRTTYVLYHHLEDEASVFATLLSTPERCIEPLFFAAALYRSHHQHIETHRNAIDDAIQSIERQTSFGRHGMLRGSQRRPSLDQYPSLIDPKETIQHLSYCQTNLAIC